MPNDAVVSRNSIDAILNNPNRYNHWDSLSSAALGLAEHDSEEAWQWLNSQPQYVAQRESMITDWITSAVRSGDIPEWPLVEGIPSSLAVSESVRRIMGNLDRLGLSESDTAALHLKLEKLTIGLPEE